MAAPQTSEVYQTSEVCEQATIHYRRAKADYDGWGLHIWGPTAVAGVTWTSPLLPAGTDEYGIYWVIDMQANADNLEYIVHKGDQKDPGPDQKLIFAEKGCEIWLIEGSGEQFTDPETAQEGLLAASLGDITNRAQAHWLTSDAIGWPVDFDSEASYTLHYAPAGGIRITPDGLQGGQTIPLEFAGSTVSNNLAERFPHLWNAHILKIPAEYLELVPEILKGQMAISAADADGAHLGATALQIPGVLDDLYADSASGEPLGVVWEGDTPTLQVWAPTAQFVKLLLYDDATSDERQSIPMEWDSATGIWSATGEPEWKSKYYQYAVDVFVRQEGKVVTNLVTDPYSFSLSMNSARSQIVDLNDPALMPAGWESLAKPPLEAFTDIVLYELHLRDFSVRDETVPEEQRGTFMAFTHPETAGMQHLSWLSDAGVTHVHLLPTFDIATINENKAEWQSADFDELASYPPDSEAQQAAVNAIRGQDGFNWGYDPYHYTVPEGSYSTDPNGPARILEFRQMVQALNQSGLRVVMDVVYNHTNASGQSEKSVLDRVVPGYYHRLDANGGVTNSTCCSNTATEHAMMRKLMIDSVLTWAAAYKVDGFRFDLMGHHMKADMEALRAAVDALTPEADGVDGGMVYIYGEGWDFSEVADNARGVNATQSNMAGTGIGTFNDRLRDAVRGGSPFSNQQEQGYATGLYTDPNEVNDLSEASQLSLLLKLKDQIRVSLAGNLADYEVINSAGRTVSGAQIKYNGQSAGYTQQPQEHIVYVSAHDNETLFDAIQYKAPLTASLEDRVRMQSLSLSIVALSQGVPFYHAGSELLRSKSMDRDSYDSGDWFNALDWTYNDNNWGHGLPVEDKNSSQWEVIGDLLGREELTPSQEDILLNRALFGEWLQIRRSSPLFRLRTAVQINALVRFHNTGPDQVPGLIVMSISDDTGNPLDANYGLIVVLFNADPDEVSFELANWEIGNLALHPVQAEDTYAAQAMYDAATQTFTVPGRSTVVFVGDSPATAVEVEEVAAAEEIAVEPTEAATEEPEAIEPTQAATEEPEAVEQAAEAESAPIWPWVLGGAVLVAAGLAGYAVSTRNRKK
ncbi:MAG: pullulanase-type alpha-1,6-glucosidase [Chloroflexi bacterium]|nr:pullulanase-type alpha-1,6-glucosidase [Chloroflexota bacterium]